MKKAIELQWMQLEKELHQQRELLCVYYLSSPLAFVSFEVFMVYILNRGLSIGPCGLYVCMYTN